MEILSCVLSGLAIACAIFIAIRQKLAQKTATFNAAFNQILSMKNIRDVIKKINNKKFVLANDEDDLIDLLDLLTEVFYADKKKGKQYCTRFLAPIACNSDVVGYLNEDKNKIRYNLILCVIIKTIEEGGFKEYATIS